MVPIEEKYFDYGDVLTPYGIVVRYPNELMLEEHHAKTAIEYAGEILNWVEELVGAEELCKENIAAAPEKETENY